ncbi:SAF domain-containing protein [Calidifontibacter indicus]|uniref:Flagellar basal body P-ring formation chaperone FlgA n=1 Tax=Calidifontibacter indicus TaxID=419650 RepID=A0A3D9UM55_9MICO|nr:SAF domain-containing protein [Calidifontibacter indicus]REF30538.1 flagellar basal body P-ring formation chaperone FlgA [Calidifontibacter indicus]
MGETRTADARTAQRLQKPSWKDGRLIAGVLLVVVAMLLGAMTLKHFDSSVQVLRAKHTLLPGDTVSAADVEVVKVRLDGGRKGYFGPPGKPGGTVLREVRAGELVPTSAVGSAAEVKAKSIGVPVSGSQAAALVRGSVVDVWVARRTPGATGTNDFQQPTREVQRATVHRVPSAGSGLGVSTGGDQVYVLVPDVKVATLIESVNGGAKVTLVPAAGSPMKSN